MVSKKSNPVLEIAGLRAVVERRDQPVEVISSVDLRVAAGETVGLVGESGCGKSMTGLAIMGLLPSGGQVSSGSIQLNGKELVGLPEREYRRVRGADVSMVFQDPMTSLNPTKTIGEQVAEPVRLHQGATRRQARARAEEMLGLVGIARPAERMDVYPHQLSGGLRQRVMIAMALICEPSLLIADEPTTALDVTVQAQVLEMLHSLQEQLGMAMLLITHDMGVVARWADRVNVMYSGRMVEGSSTGDLFARTRHRYSGALLASIPRLDQPKDAVLPSIPGIPPDLADPPSGCRFAPRCAVADARCHTEEPSRDGDDDHWFACWHPTPDRVVPLTLNEGPEIAEAFSEPISDEIALSADSLVKEFHLSGGGLFSRSEAKVHAVSDVSFSVRRGQTFALVGESGCGKSTLARMLVGLERPTSGDVSVFGVDLASLSGKRLRRHRRNLQMMFQDPLDSLDPRMRVEAILREPFEVQGIGNAQEQRAEVARLLEEVGLPADAADRYPHEFSGGQRQRVGLARALALRPEVIVADEPVSALDMSIRSQVLNLMKRLQRDHELTYVVISHDLTVVRYLADVVGVMYLGTLVEVGPAEDIFRAPAHPYTAGLLSAIPEPDPLIERAKDKSGVAGELPSAVTPPSGCRFRTRCPMAQPKCEQEAPPLRAFAEGHTAACHFPLVEPLPGLVFEKNAVGAASP